MKTWPLKELPILPKLKLAVVGHLEWVSFLKVDHLPKAGSISHSSQYLEEPAGGGGVVAVQLSRLINQEVDFYTALGKDSIGYQSCERLKELGVKPKVAWKNMPTRKAISMIDSKGERAITVVGDRLQPSINDNLPWDCLGIYDGVFVSAADSETLTICRQAKTMVATPRVGLKNIELSKIILDALIGSGLDPDEEVVNQFSPQLSRINISTEGRMGGKAFPGGRYQAVKLTAPLKDSYGCGDNFAAGVTAGLAAGWNIEKSISLGAHCGAKCATHLGPYPVAVSKEMN